MYTRQQQRGGCGPGQKTGKPLWQSTEFTDGAHYSSIIQPTSTEPGNSFSELKGCRGISPSGQTALKTSFPGKVAVVPTPIYRDGHVYVTAGYGAGCKLIKIGPGSEVTTIYEHSLMKNHHGGVVLVGEHFGHADPGWLVRIS